MHILRTWAALVVAVAAACAGTPASVSLSPDPTRFELATQAAVPKGETPQPCAAALIEGRLIPDDESGLGLRDDEGDARHVLWPHGYYGIRTEAGTLALVDPAHQEVALVGDRVRLGGGELGATGWKVCGLVERAEQVVG